MISLKDILNLTFFILFYFISFIFFIFYPSPLFRTLQFVQLNVKFNIVRLV